MYEMLYRLYSPTAVAWPLLTRATSAAVGQQRHLQSLSSFVCYEDDQHSIRDSSLPKPVWECLHQLRAAGHEVYVVGGAIRDLLLQCQEPKDFDLLTSAQLHKVKELFQHHKPRIIGRNFPICQLDVKGVKIEISSLHTRPSTKPWSAAAVPAGVPADVAEHLLGSCTAPGRGRRSSVLPHIVQQQQQPLSWAAARRSNAAARDFTVNALLYDPFQRILFDYVGGMTDLTAKQLRCVGDARVRLQADPACLLRAVRCAARAGLQLEADTLSAIQQHASLAASLNPQRITAELMSMLSYGAAAASLRLLQQTQLLQQVLPLHHQHMQRQLQQTAACQTSDISESQSTGNCCGKHADQLEEDLRHHSSQSVDPIPNTRVLCQPTADSALGRMLHGLTAQQSPQQSQKQLGTWQQQTERLRRLPDVRAAASTGRVQDQINPMQQVIDEHQVLLLKVAAALDQHVGVKQPAAAEVVLACLTAPLVIESLQDAVAQLQWHLQQQLQQQPHQDIVDVQQQQQHGGPENAEQQGQQTASYVGTLDGPLQQHSSSSQGMWGKYVVDYSSAVSQQQVSFAAAAGARAISTNSSTTRSRDHKKFADVDLAPAAQQLLSGADFKALVEQQALALATQVCRMSTGIAANNSSGQLFGVHTPALAAALLAAHVDVCVRTRQLREARVSKKAAARKSSKPVSLQSPLTLQGQHSLSGQSRQHTHNSTSKGQRHISSSLPASQQVDGHVEHYEESYPRTNKQYRKLMQQHHHGGCQQQYLAGDLGMIPSSKAILAAAAEAVYAADWQVQSLQAAWPAGTHCHQQHANLVAGVALSFHEHMVHQVLTAACVGFDILEAMVAQMSLHRSGAR